MSGLPRCGGGFTVLMQYNSLNPYIINAFIDSWMRINPESQEKQKLHDYLTMISYDYMQMFYGAHAWHQNKYKGLQILKFPNDLWIMGEIIQEIEPDLIIECGTRNGASALWFGDQLNVIGKGEVVTIEIESNGEMPFHDRVTYIKGSSTSKEIVEQVAQIAEGKKCVIVNLDSDHSTIHVLRELELYHQFVTEGSYLIVEDTVIGGHPVEVLHENGTLFEDGPWEAVHKFLPKHPEFIIDHTRERFQITSNPHGYLKRRKNA